MINVNFKIQVFLTSSCDKSQNAERRTRADMPTLGQIVSKHGEAGAQSTRQNYLTALRSLLKYLQRDDIRADELTPQLLSSYSGGSLSEVYV